MGAFKTPTVCNIAETAPYMRDGSLATLKDVMNHYVGYPEVETNGRSGATMISPAKRQRAA